MNGKSETGLDKLMRLVALLFWFGDMAEWVADHPRRRRAYALTVLRSAETKSWTIVMRRMQAAGMPALALYALMPHCSGNSSDDALALAARFRTLALALMQLAAAYSVPGESHHIRLTDQTAKAMRDMLTAMAVIARPALPRSCFDTC